MIEEFPALAVAASLNEGSPLFHGSNAEANWNATPNSLVTIARYTAGASHTCETGVGASTVVFAASGAAHIAISPVAAEHERVREYCQQKGVDVSKLTLLEGSSDEVLPSLKLSPLDFAFVDGAHAFPYPIVDWHFLAQRVRIGGFLFLDDVPIPSVRYCYEFMRSDEAWRLVTFVDDRGALFERVKPDLIGDFWRAQGINRKYPDYSYLPARQQMPFRLISTAHRAKRFLRGFTAAGRREADIRARQLEMIRGLPSDDE